MIKKFKQLDFEILAISLGKIYFYSNIHQIPKIDKICINRCLGINAQNKKILKKSIEEFCLITGQYPIVTKAKKAIASFKLKKGMDLGITVILRNKKMFYFLDHLINLALPQIRDFKGLNPQKFDKYCNYNFGIKDQLIFPEIDYDNVDQVLGLNITLITSTINLRETLSLVKNLGLPFYD